MDHVRWGTPLLVLALMEPTASTFAAPFAYVANHADGNVTVFDTATNQVVDTITVGNQPLGVAVDPEGAHVYVANQDGPNGNVSVITTKTKAVATIPVGDDPTGVALKPPGNRLYVANRVDQTVSVIDTATNQVIDSVSVGANPLGIAIDPSGTPAYVVNRGDDSVTVIDTATNAVITTIPIPGSHPTHAAVSPAGELVYVTSEGGAVVSVINAASLSVTGTISVGAVPDGVVFSTDGTRAFVANSGPNTVSVIDTTSSQVIDTIDVGEQPEDVALHPNGKRLYVMNRNDNTVSVIDTATHAEIDTDGDASNGITRIPTGRNPVALENALLPVLIPPAFAKAALACQAAIAAQARAFAKNDQGQRTACQTRLLKDVSSGKGTQQADAFCASASDLANPQSAVAKARTAAHAAVVKKCGALLTAQINRPCDRSATSFADAATCVLDQHAARVDEMVDDTFAVGDPQALSKPALTCQTTIAKAASKLAQTEQAQLDGCLVRTLKDAAKGKSLALSAAACAKALDRDDPKASIPKLRTALAATIVKKCAGATPADIGSPCDPAAATIADVATCVLDGQESRAQKMVAGEFNDACLVLTAVGLGRDYPDVCSGL